MPDPTEFDRAIALAPGAEGLIGHTSPAYANMVGPFGGITAAQTLQAVLLHPQRLGEPTAATFNFCAALADGPFSALARPLRTNRSTQHWFVELQQQGQTCISASVVTALRRETWGDDEHRMPEAPAPESLPVPRKASVEWFNRYEMRFVEGGFHSDWDGSDHGTSLTRMWVRDRPPRPLDHASLTAIADAFYPRVWRRRATQVPIGTVSMTVYYHADGARLQHTGSGWLLGQASAQAFRQGFFDQSAQLWNEAGELLATTHQLVYYKE